MSSPPFQMNAAAYGVELAADSIYNGPFGPPTTNRTSVPVLNKPNGTRKAPQLP